MATAIEIRRVEPATIDKEGFFCRKSKMKTVGNRRKVQWATEQMRNGLGIEILYEDGRSKGFVEYTPGEYAWRAVQAPGYLLIHCIWVVGRAKGNGYGRRLLERAEAAARAAGCTGVAMVTSDGVWLADKGLFEALGYTSVDEAPPSFALMTKPFEEGPRPRFPTDFDAKAAAFGDGLTVVTTDQCPYLDDAEQTILAAAEAMGIPARIEKLESAADVQTRAPSPYGVFGVVLDGKLLSYHYLLEKDLRALIAERS
jgi:GNAT superfamily N-acetyltransferase